MHQRLALREDELDAQALELLPARETLFFDVNIANVIGVNVSLAINAASFGTTASSMAGQGLFVFQH
jgi:hypothetical protein